MSGDRILIEGSDARVALSSPVPSKDVAYIEQSQWRQARLIEARGILADITQHPDTLVILACQVVCSCNADAFERADALGVMRLLNAPSPVTASTAPKGGVA